MAEYALYPVKGTTVNLLMDFVGRAFTLVAGGKNPEISESIESDFTISL